MPAHEPSASRDPALRTLVDDWTNDPAVAALAPAETDSGIPLQPLYTPLDWSADQYVDDLGIPGRTPFTRGVYSTMHRGKRWSIRQYAGFATAEESNERYRYLLQQGQTALSVAFDLPTQIGYDSDHPLAHEEVGMVGVAIDNVGDLDRLFDGLPLDRLSVNFTINATAPIILAYYLVIAERRGLPWERLSGTLQNDILKELLARGTYIYPPAPSLRLTCDVIEFCSQQVPRLNPISITGYHAREAGCNAIQELGFTMAAATTYVDAVLARGLDIDHFAPRLSFHFATTLDFFEEVAKLRAARRMWARIVEERYHSTNPRSQALRFFSGCSGQTLTAQEPHNNVIRNTIQCLAAVLGGAQSIHVMGYDEALGIPSEDAVRLAIRTQQIVAEETGVTKAIDPLGGSWLVESLTRELEQRATEMMHQFEATGGFVAALERGDAQAMISENAYRQQRALESGEKRRVGLNIHDDSGERPQSTGETFHLDPAARDRQIQRLNAWRRDRDDNEVGARLDTLVRDAGGSTNVMPALLDAVRAGATTGEMADALRGVFGEYRGTQF